MNRPIPKLFFFGLHFDRASMDSFTVMQIETRRLRPGYPGAILDYLSGRHSSPAHTYPNLAGLEVITVPQNIGY